MANTWYLFFLLLFSIIFIIWMTAVRKINAFYALSLTALGVGLLSGLPLNSIIQSLKVGFGSAMEKTGLIILTGTALGVILEKTGATMSMANAVLKRINGEQTPAAMAVTGVIVGLPIFCDSGFIILSGLNHSLVKRAKQNMPVMAATLATSLYAVHCLVPPHPGITAAAGTMGGQIGLVMLVGLALAIPAAIIGYSWSVYKGNREKDKNHISIDEEHENSNLPSAGLSFFPVILPIILIGCKSILQLTAGESIHPIIQILYFLGDPVMALTIGLVFSFLLLKKDHKKNLNHWLTDAVLKAGIILAIIAAGGMFGEMMQATGMGKNIGEILKGLSPGIFLPFLMAMILKTAQGSSTVAIIATAALIAPLLGDLGLDSIEGTTLAILSMGAGSMVVSHANDSYFWVISRFSGIDTGVTFRVFTIATLIMGLAIQLIIWIVSLFLL